MTNPINNTPLVTNIFLVPGPNMMKMDGKTSQPTIVGTLHPGPRGRI